MIPRDLGLPDLRKFAAKLRPKLEALVESEQMTAIAHVSSKNFDRAYLGAMMIGALDDKDTEMLTAYGTGLRWLSDESDRDKGGKQSWLSMSFEASFFAVGGGKTLAMALGGKALCDMFAKQIGAVEYGYWDNTEWPEGVTPREWGQSKRDWQKALGKSFEPSPSEAGVSLNLGSNNSAQWWFPEPEALAERLTRDDFSPPMRAQGIASEFFKNQCFDKILQEYPELLAGGDSGTDFSDRMSVDRTWRKYARTPHGAANVARCVDWIAAGLPKIDAMSLGVKARDVVLMGAAVASSVKDRVRWSPRPRRVPSHTRPENHFECQERARACAFDSADSKSSRAAARCGFSRA